MISLLLALLTAEPQTREGPPPPACIGATFVSWEACAAAAPEGSPAYVLAMINLGTQAYMNGDRGAALNFYDKAGEGRQVASDVILHAFRADTYRYAGRMDEARTDAAIAWGYLDGRPPQGLNTLGPRPIDDPVRFVVLASILPIMKIENADFSRAREMFMALPANDWSALTRRANVLSELGEHAGAVADSKRAVDLQPDHPMLQNNHCYTLVEAGRAAEGLPYCERAVALAPEAAPIRHSIAAALAGMGQCAAADRQLAEARRLEPEANLYRQPIPCTPKG
ncbi:tetratricopeptide repeat protein [Brevundimonas sp.]|uniref:tetratricopeptide repeat protein n=1 Tax=Brevundimonas sp. TaxID=1871086 RepID=UPI003F705DEF